LARKFKQLNLRGAARIALALASLPAATVSVMAGTACVICAGPAQTYRCEVSADNALPPHVTGLYCVSRIAKDHHHASCAAARGQVDCEGIAVSYAYEEGLAPSAAAAPETPDAPDEGGGQKREPETLHEMTKDSVDASASAVKKAGENIGEAASKAGKATTDALKSAGKAIGDATKKTFKCLGSALNDC
jgi:hypothetical protein